MLRLFGVAVRRGARLLLSGVDLVAYPGQKVGVTGANGAGKSSLFEVITGTLEADAGEVTLSGDPVIAEVRQDMPVSAAPAIDYVMDGDLELRALERHIDAAQRQDDGTRLAHLHGELQSIDGFSARARAGRLLHGLGFAAAEHEQAVEAFSGGWRMRLNLARALMRRSDLLLLDEPTNHLDLDALVWLETWLAEYAGILLLITHDREFLDRVVTHVAHLENATVTTFAGNYSAAEAQRAELLLGQQQQYDKQQREIAHMRRFVDRFRYKASKARQAQSRLKALERMATVAAVHAESEFRFEFEKPDAVPDPILELRQVQAGYDGLTVLRDVTLSLQAGARIGLLGANGAGKSTLMKVLARHLEPQAGDSTAHRNLRIGYFAQHELELLSPAESPLAHLRRIAGDAREASLRGFLGRFGFPGEMAGEPVEIRSGGEKARLVLAMLVYQKPNLLLLDEPTNHLDMQMRQAITAALQDFEGSLVIVAHDRYLLRLVTDELWLVDAGAVTRFDGDLDDYVRWLNERQRNAAARPAGTSPESARDVRRRRAAARDETRELRTKVLELERRLEKLETRQSEIETLLADNAVYAAEHKQRLRELLAERGQAAGAREALEEEWLEAAHALERLEEVGAGK